MGNQPYDTNTASEHDFDDVRDLLEHSSDRFIDAFSGCCASIVVVLNTLASLDPPEPLDESNDIVARLCVVAGAVGYPSLAEVAPER